MDSDTIQLLFEGVDQGLGDMIGQLQGKLADFLALATTDSSGTFSSGVESATALTSAVTTLAAAIDGYSASISRSTGAATSNTQAVQQNTATLIDANGTLTSYNSSAATTTETLTALTFTVVGLGEAHAATSGHAKEHGETTEKVALKTGELKEKVLELGGIALPGLGTAYSTASQAAHTLQEAHEKEINTLTEVGGGLAAVGIAIAAISFESFESGTERLHQLALQSGMTETAVAGLQFSMESVGVSSDKLQTTIMIASRNLQTMQQQLDAGKEPSSNFAKALRDLGVEATGVDGKVRPFGDLLPEIMDAFKAASDKAKESGTNFNAAGLAVELFGRSGGTLVPLLEQGSATLNHFTEEAKALGIGTEDQVKKLEDWKRSAAELHLVMTALADGLGSSVEPVLVQLVRVATDFFQWFDKLPGPVKELLITLPLFTGLILVADAVISTLVGRTVTFIGHLTALTAAHKAAAAAAGEQAAEEGVLATTMTVGGGASMVPQVAGMAGTFTAGAAEAAPLAAGIGAAAPAAAEATAGLGETIAAAAGPIGLGIAMLTGLALVTSIVTTHNDAAADSQERLNKKFEESLPPIQKMISEMQRAGSTPEAISAKLTADADAAYKKVLDTNIKIGEAQANLQSAAFGKITPEALDQLKQGVTPDEIAQQMRSRAGPYAFADVRGAQDASMFKQEVNTPAIKEALAALKDLTKARVDDQGAASAANTAIVEYEHGLREQAAALADAKEKSAAFAESILGEVGMLHQTAEAHTQLDELIKKSSGSYTEHMTILKEVQMVQEAVAKGTQDALKAQLEKITADANATQADKDAATELLNLINIYEKLGPTALASAASLKTANDEFARLAGMGAGLAQSASAHQTLTSILGTETQSVQQRALAETQIQQALSLSADKTKTLESVTAQYKSMLDSSNPVASAYAKTIIDLYTAFQNLTPEEIAAAEHAQATKNAMDDIAKAMTAIKDGTGTAKQALDEIDKQFEAGLTTLQQYHDALNNVFSQPSKDELGFASQIANNNVTISGWNATLASSGGAVQAIAGLTKQLDDEKRSGQDTTETLRQLNNQLAQYTGGNGQAIVAQQQMIDKLTENNKALTAQKDALGAQRQAQIAANDAQNAAALSIDQITKHLAPAVQAQKDMGTATALANDSMASTPSRMDALGNAAVLNTNKVLGLASALRGLSTDAHVGTGQSPYDDLLNGNTGAAAAIRAQYPVTQGFGYTSYAATSGREPNSFHSGIDLGYPQGTPVQTFAGGKVIQAGPNGGYGNSVTIDLGNGYTEVLGHLSQIAVELGQVVKSGQQIGLSGNTGNSDGPHLHVELRLNGQAVDPSALINGTLPINIDVRTGAASAGTTTTAMTGMQPIATGKYGQQYSQAQMAGMLQAAGASPQEAALLSAVFMAESGGWTRVPNAQGSGAMGIAQFMPGTWAGMGQSGSPADASAAQQLATALALYRKYGPNQWEAYSAGTYQQFLGGAGGGSAGGGATGGIGDGGDAAPFLPSASSQPTPEVVQQQIDELQSKLNGVLRTSGVIKQVSDEDIATAKSNADALRDTYATAIQASLDAHLKYLSDIQSGNTAAYKADEEAIKAVDAMMGSAYRKYSDAETAYTTLVQDQANQRQQVRQAEANQAAAMADLMHALGATQKEDYAGATQAQLQAAQGLQAQKQQLAIAAAQAELQAALAFQAAITSGNQEQIKITGDNYNLKHQLAQQAIQDYDTETGRVTQLTAALAEQQKNLRDFDKAENTAERAAARAQARANAANAQAQQPGVTPDQRRGYAATAASAQAEADIYHGEQGQIVAARQAYQTALTAQQAQQTLVDALQQVVKNNPDDPTALANLQQAQLQLTMDTDMTGMAFRRLQGITDETQDKLTGLADQASLASQAVKQMGSDLPGIKPPAMASSYDLGNPSVGRTTATYGAEVMGTPYAYLYGTQYLSGGASAAEGVSVSNAGKYLFPYPPGGGGEYDPSAPWAKPPQAGAQTVNVAVHVYMDGEEIAGATSSEYDRLRGLHLRVGRQPRGA